MEQLIFGIVFEARRRQRVRACSRCRQRQHCNSFTSRQCVPQAQLPVQLFLDFQVGHDIDEYSQKCAYFKARELRGKYGFNEEDLRDLEQELLLRLWSQRHHYDPRRGKWSTFCNRIFANHIANIIAHRRAACRDYRKCIQIG